MKRVLEHYISPNFTHEKLEPPFFRDIVDVFEDRMRYWLIEPAKSLLAVRHGEVAAVSFATSYFEGIEIYFSGKDSRRASEEFFCRGFMRVFPLSELTSEMHAATAKAIYEFLRCGVAHEASFRDRIFFSRVRKEALTITWPKLAGRFDPSARMESAVINPDRFVAGIESHFNQYVRELRSPKDSEVKQKFKSVVELKWNLGQPGPYLAMTEEEFFRPE